MGEKIIKLAFVGDVCLASPHKAQSSGIDVPGWPAILEAIGEHDFLVGNLECCLVDDRCSADARRQPMAVPSEAAAVLRAMGFSDLCLANNHVPDSGSCAITVTRDRLSSLGIRAFGAGSDRREAEEAAIVSYGGHNIAFLAACDYSEYFADDHGQSGIAPLKSSRLCRRVRAAAAQADFVVATLHADLEFSEVPGRWRQRLSRALIRHGANLVVQHHPHVLQGVEAYRGGIIAYSLGNFMFGVRGNRYQERETGVFDSAVLVVDADFTTTPPRLSYRIIPVRIGDDHLPVDLTGASANAAIRRFEHLSELVTQPSRHRRAWLQRCRKEASIRFFRIYYACRRGDIRRAAQELWRLVVFPEDRRWIIGVLSLGYR